MFDQPVPPPETVSNPDIEGVNVRAPDVGTKVPPRVKPLNVEVVVENVIAVPVVVAYPLPNAVK